MPTAILIGFEYTFNMLPGAIVDLYHANNWCKTFDCDVYIFTDIENNKNNSIDNEIVKSDFVYFYDRITKRYIVKNSIEMMGNIVEIIGNGIVDNKLIIYYSGHGVKDCIVMPDRSLLPFIDFRENILNVLNQHVEIFCILDCCNPNGMYLPYKLVGNGFGLSSTKIKCISQPMILITSSESYEKSIATKEGSVFSRHLFRILTRLFIDEKKLLSSISINSKKIIIPVQKNRNLRRLIGELSSSIRSMHTGYDQTVSIYSSYVIDPILWMWIGNNKPYDLVIDISLSTLIIRTNELSSELKYNPYDNI